jgi:hypothetical protein
MPETAIAPNVNITFDIEIDLFPQIAFDLDPLIYRLADAIYLIIC